jgi:UDP-glucuronate 4-epimerase
MGVLITGVAGFIGSQLAARLLAAGETVAGIDNFDAYYDPAVKRARLHALTSAAQPGQFRFFEADVRSPEALQEAFSALPVRAVAHLAAMSGVRYSAERGPLYAAVNVLGSVNMMEAARQAGVGVFLQASTSNVYGASAVVPFREDDPAVEPLAPYPASKRAAELFARSYHHLHGMNITVLRFFNVYGPQGRPDMMPIRVLDALMSGQPIPAYGGGELQRDWTYIDDVIDGVLAALERPLGYQIINLGCGAPLSLLAFIHIYERLTGRSARIETAPMPLTEVPITYCDNTRARELLGFAPRIGIEDGLARTWAWYAQAQAAGG